MKLVGSAFLWVIVVPLLILFSLALLVFSTTPNQLRP